MTSVRSPRTRIFRPHVLLACAAAVGLPLVAACGGGAKADHKATTPPSTQTAGTPSPDRTVEARTAAAAAYVHMWDAAAAAFHAGMVTSPELESWAVDKALANMNASGLYYRQRGTIMDGRPTLNPRVTSVDFTRQPYTANITDCADTTHFVEVSKSTGKPVAPSTGSRRHVVTAVARFNGKSWVITDAVVERDRTC